MKSTTQTVVLLGALLAVVFVVTFLSQWVSTEQTKKPGDGAPPIKEDANARRLEFSQTAANEGFLVEMSPTTGSHDFYFKNTHDVPIEVALESKSCKCAKVQLSTLTSEEDHEFKNGDRYAAAQVLAAAANPMSGIGTSWMVAKRLGFALPGERWQTVEDIHAEKPPLVVPPRSTGFLRVGWDGKAPGPQRLKAVIVTNGKGSEARAKATLEVAVQFTPALALSSTSLDLSLPIREGKSANGSVYCWSFTRGAFDVKVDEKDKDPCIECETTAIDREDVQHLAGKDAPAIRTAYRIKVTVHSSRGDRSLDMGPFTRNLDVTSASQESWQGNVRVTGAIEGNIRVVSEGGKDVVSLEDFRASKGAQKRVTLEADGDVTLTLESKAPSYLGVKLEELAKSANAKKQWNLQVTVPPDRADGRMPMDSGVVLKTNEQPPRRIRIPVRGHASN